MVEGGSTFLPGLLTKTPTVLGCPLTMRPPSSSPGLLSLKESLVFLPATVTGRTEEIRLKAIAATAWGKEEAKTSIGNWGFPLG